MGHWEEQHGEFKLPSADFARVRKAVEEADRQYKERVFAETQSFWKGLKGKQKSDKSAYRAAIADHVTRIADAPTGRIRTDSFEREVFAGDVATKLYARADVSRVTKAEMGFPTNRTTVFNCGTVSIRFDRATSMARFDIEEGRQVIARAEVSPVFVALMGAIVATRWTRGTGGRIWGDDEYAAEARGTHGGSFTLDQRGFGPIGADACPMMTDPWTDPSGQQFHVELKQSRGGGLQPRIAKGMPARVAGTFTYRQRPEAPMGLLGR